MTLSRRHSQVYLNNYCTIMHAIIWTLASIFITNTNDYGFKNFISTPLLPGPTTTSSNKKSHVTVTGLRTLCANIHYI